MNTENKIESTEANPVLVNRLYNNRPYWMDYYLSNYKWYRKLKKGMWHKHQFTKEALELSLTFTGTFWARYNNINRYSTVIFYEVY